MLSDKEVENQLTARRLDIEQLQRQLNDAVNKLSSLSTQVTESAASASTGTAKAGNDLDAFFSGGRVVHKLKHLFQAAVEFASTLTFSGLTASRPLKLDSSKNVISAKVDLTQVNDVTGSTTLQVPVGNTSGTLSFGSSLTWDSASTIKAHTIVGAGITRYKVSDSTDSVDAVLQAQSGGAYVGSLTNHNFGIFANSGAPSILIINTGEVQLANVNLAFWGGTPVGKQTLSSYITNDQSAAYSSTPISLLTAATLADLNTLRVAYENLRLAHDDLRTKMKTSTFLG